MNISINKIVIVTVLVCLMSVNLLAQDIIINELMSSNATTIEDYNGKTSDWIELYNSSSTSQNLQGFFISDDLGELDKWEFPNVSIPSSGFLLIWASGKNTVYSNGELHTNFKIKSSGEEIFLVKPDGFTIIEQSPSRNLEPDMSIGHKPDNFNDWFTFTEATPNLSNTTSGYLEIAKKPTFSHSRGFYSGSISVSLAPDNTQDIIYYTTDGSKPTISSSVYSIPIEISSTTSLRVKVYRSGAIPSVTYTNTYIFENNLSLSTISLVTNHSNFWGTDGIYTNYNSGVESPVHIEYFEEDGTPGFSLDAGVKIHAPDSKPQKSLRLYARSEYGTKNIEYKVFENLNITRFKRLVLRNGGNDGAKFQKTHIRDAFIHKVYKQLCPENAVSAYKPVHLYINANYWGIYNLRERQDEHYIKDNFGYDVNEIDFLEYDYSEPSHQKIIAGNWNDFNNLKDYVINNDMSVDGNFQIMDDWMDMDNFIDYQIIEIFTGNQDWLNNNIKFWRPKASGNKWKWVLWDTEFGLGTNKTYAVGKPDFDFFNMAMTWGGWGNDDYTWLLRNLMENERFKNRFISRTLDLLNTIYLPSYTNNVLNNLANTIAADMYMQFGKWGSSYPLWEEDIEYTSYHLNERPNYLREHIAQFFEFDEALFDITVDVSNANYGMVKVNTIIIAESTPGVSDIPYPWTGKYFSNRTVTVKAIAKPGYEFVRWEGYFSSTDAEISFILDKNIDLIAVFSTIDSIIENDDTNKQLQFEIFPVPAVSTVDIKITNNKYEMYVLEIFNVSAMQILQKDIPCSSNYEFVFDVSSLKSGIYIAKIVSESGLVKTQKFLVQHD